MISFVTCWLMFQTASPLLQEFGPYKPEILSPAAFLGFEPGQVHAGPHQLVAYAKYLESVSDRVRIEEMGQTHEFQKVIQMIITAPSNFDQAYAERGQRLERQFVVVSLGYSIHGNEASGSQVSLLSMYLLAASEHPWVMEKLKSMVILLDPSLNPDGLRRFTTWANSHRSPHPSTDTNDREHREGWPNGRTNHYWFDLNRDWLPASQPESKARVEQFQKWRPHVFTDFHEMGSNSTYFFQPGEPKRVNPLTPKLNQELTFKIAEFHAKAFDEQGMTYYHGEGFDDYYYGKGSTYPDVQGTIGILFEQGTSRGHAIETPWGTRTLADAMKGHWTTTLSTLQACYEMKEDILAYPKKFEEMRQERDGNLPYCGFIFSAGQNQNRLNKFLDLLNLHQIKWGKVERELRLGNYEYQANTSYFVSLDQSQSGLVRTIFEHAHTFEEPVFYDISGWTLAAAFGLHYDSVPKKLADMMINLTQTPPADPHFHPEGQNLAFIIPWDQDHAAPAAYALLREGFQVSTNQEQIQLPNQLVPAGSLVVMDQNNLEESLESIQKKMNLRIISVNSGLHKLGPDLGSPNMHLLKNKPIMLVIGPGLRTYDCGELWHTLAYRFGAPVTLVDSAHVNGVDWHDYQAMFLAGLPDELRNEKSVDRLKQWVRNGGRLWVQKQAAEALANFEGFPISMKKWKEENESDPVPFKDRELHYSARRVNGVVLTAEVDTSHPLGFGLQSKQPVFSQFTTVLQPGKSPFSTPIRYTQKPLLSGYLSQEIQDHLAGTPYLVSERHGSGWIVAVQGTAAFRGFWIGTEKIMANFLLQEAP